MYVLSLHRASSTNVRQIARDEFHSSRSHQMRAETDEIVEYDFRGDYVVFRVYFLLDTAQARCSSPLRPHWCCFDIGRKSGDSMRSLYKACQMAASSVHTGGARLGPLQALVLPT